MRDIEVVSEQWRGGGAPNDLNHTRIYDLVWAEPGVQEEALSIYPSVTSGAVADLDADQFAVIPMLEGDST